jgi:hypothetical protein
VFGTTVKDLPGFGLSIGRGVTVLRFAQLVMAIKAGGLSVSVVT